MKVIRKITEQQLLRRRTDILRYHTEVLKHRFIIL